jgi:hypothetical protein
MMPAVEPLGCDAAALACCAESLARNAEQTLALAERWCAEGKVSGGGPFMPALLMQMSDDASTMRRLADLLALLAQEGAGA